MTQKPAIHIIDPDDYQWVDPITAFFKEQRASLQNPNWLLDRQPRHFHAIIGGKRGERILIATTPNVAGGVHIRGIITFETGTLTMGTIADPSDDIKNTLAGPDLRKAFAQAAKNQKIGIIGCLLTDEAYRKNGLALDLVKAVLNYAVDEAQIPHIGAYVAQENHAARAAFAKAGLRILGQNPREDGTARYAMGVHAEIPSLTCAA